ncbi:regulatory protein, arsR family [Frankineae bacterium MT45]|nr:regulatory protein, arsR family [Frankineae bacterium MT45]
MDLGTLTSTIQFGDKPGLEKFLWPDTSVTEMRTLEEQVDELAATPHDLILQEITTYAGDDRLSLPALWIDRPQRALAVYIDALRSYIADVLSPLYPRFEERIRRETLYLRDLVARGRWAYSLYGLHPDVQLDNGTLTFSPLADREDRDRSTGDLVFTPMISMPKTVAINGDFNGECGPQVIGFATRNLAVNGLATPETMRHSPLGTLLGDARAAILQALFIPSTTTELANDLGYSPSTISHHLKALTSAGAIESHRNQRFVYYRITDVGWRLTQLYR